MAAKKKPPKKQKVETNGITGVRADYDPEPLMTRPERVAIVALGRSMDAFYREVMSPGAMKKPFDEVWACNRGVKGIEHDKLFCMDDFSWIEQKDPYYANFLKAHDKPIFCSTSYSDYPMAIPYPLQEVMATIQDDVFTVNTISYMLAYAIHIGVKEISVYGADFYYPGGNNSEEGGQALCYLLGMGRYFGFTHKIPQTSTLLYANRVKQHPNGVMSREPYGFHRIREMAEKKAKEKQGFAVANREEIL